MKGIGVVVCDSINSMDETAFLQVFVQQKEIAEGNDEVWTSRDFCFSLYLWGLVFRRYLKELILLQIIDE